jgi:hypothetical protein
MFLAVVFAEPRHLCIRPIAMTPQERKELQLWEDLQKLTPESRQQALETLRLLEKYGIIEPVSHLHDAIGFGYPYTPGDLIRAHALGVQL